jgi:hypothetical protein
MENIEWYSPADVVARARAVMGAIDLDPFSSDEAQRVVRAGDHWTLDGARSGRKNGYLDQYRGCTGAGLRLFVNSPGGTVDDAGMPIRSARRGQPPCTQSGSCGLPAPHIHGPRHSAQKLAWRKVVAEWLAGRASEVVFLCFSLELLQTTQVPGHLLDGELRGAGSAGSGDVGLLPLHFPICYPRRRLAYSRPSEDGSRVGASPPHASCVVYLPPRGATLVGRGEDHAPSWPGPAGRDALARFQRQFAEVGHVVVPR